MLILLYYRRYIFNSEYHVTAISNFSYFTSHILYFRAYFNTLLLLVGAHYYFAMQSHFFCSSHANLVKAVNVLLADGADEAGRVVGLAQSSNHFSLNKVPTAIAAGTVHALVVQRAQIVSIFHEEAPLGKVTATYYRRHTNWHSVSQVI